MLCYVLDGSLGLSELTLWKKLLARVEELYQMERAKFDTLTADELRAYIVLKCPRLKTAVSRVPAGKDEMDGLGDLASFVPRPKSATTFDQLIPRVICQKFRNNTPVRRALL
jgi:hypothetical protein